ncbi:UNVERIFIED_CONTAM: hypothetical protein RMT77_018167 [Armadillidium vulgare]
MGVRKSKCSGCSCIDETASDPGGSFSKNPLTFFMSRFANRNAPQMTKVERAIKAALLIQRWYRRYAARLEVRRRYTWTIFQSIEYAGEQDQMKLHNFFNALLIHIGEKGTTSLLDALSPSSSPTQDSRRPSKLGESFRIEETIVESAYKGFHLKFPVSTNVIHELIESLKKKKVVHPKYVCLLLREAAKELRKRPTVMNASTAISKQITIVGDLHGKLDDLLTILYKNGLPSTDNPYIFNGDFVDRGKKSTEVLILLAALLLAFPTEVYLNRGNHEDMVMNARYGFCKEINRKYRTAGATITKLLEEFYRWLPVATVVDGKILVVHGGISNLTDLDMISEINRDKYFSVLRMPQERVDNMDEDDYLDRDRWQHDDEIIDVTRADEEWKQILDVLWSDPQSTNGCTPNLFRGGGTYFGPDVTRAVLSRHGYDLLVRSHECKLDGYEYTHDDQCLTIFSASNYYETGSNKGAYVILQGEELKPYFVQYMADTKSKKLTFRQRVGRMESSAIRELKANLIASKSYLVEGFKEHDPDDSGFIALSEWVNVLEQRSRLALPWRVLRDRLVLVDSSTGMVDYMSTFSQETISRKSAIKGGPTLVEALYRHKNSLETIFRLLDKDNSGFITMDEFTEACDLISKHMDTTIPRDEMVDLAKSIDINKDGKIDFNEFLECFRIVDTAAKGPRLSNSGHGFHYDDFDDDDDDDDSDYDE